MKARICLAMLCFASLSTMPLGIAWADSGPIDGCKTGSQDEGFWQRLNDSYKSHLFPEPAATDSTASSSAPAGLAKEETQGYRNDLPAPPVSNPPWPYSVYPEGGTEVIGYENAYHGPLMDALYCGSNGQAWKDSRITVYGWIEPKSRGPDLASGGPHGPLDRCPV